MRFRLELWEFVQLSIIFENSFENYAYYIKMFMKSFKGKSYLRDTLFSRFWSCVADPVPVLFILNFPSGAESHNFLFCFNVKKK